MNLLTKSSRYYILFSVLIFLISGAIFYHLLHRVFYSQLDKSLKDEKQLIEETIDYADSVPDFTTIFGHLIEVTIVYDQNKKVEFIHDTVMYDGEQGKFLSYRHLFYENTSIQNKGYTINIYKPLHETESLIAGILIMISLIFITLLLMLILVNYVIARRVWIPFYRILARLGNYTIDQEKPLSVIKTNIYEFNQLNQALEKMSKKIRADFINLKEFNENAAHELQTPLAIIKSKLDLLIQQETLTEEQLKIIATVFEATARMSKLNQGLLLISKIDNDQFTTMEEVDLTQVIDETLEQFGEMTDHKHITVHKDYQRPVTLRISRVLAEILVTNLLSNAIKYNIPNGSIAIKADPARLTISNPGAPPGVDPEELFKRFRKSASSGDSAGLGLAIVQKIAQHYGMQVQYQYDGSNHIIGILFNLAR